MKDWPILGQLISDAGYWVGVLGDRPSIVVGALALFLLSICVVAVRRRHNAKQQHALPTAVVKPSSASAPSAGGATTETDNAQYDWRVVTAPAPSALLYEFKGHTGEIAGACELGEGRILSWSSDSSLRIWSPDGQLLRTFDAHVNSVRGARILSDGRILSWGGDWMPRIWSSDGAFVVALPGHQGGIVGMAELADSRLLSWSADKTLRLWSAEGTALCTLEGHRKEVFGCLQLPGGDLLSHAGDDTVRVWSTNGDCKGVLECPGGFSKSLLPDGTVLLGGNDNGVRLVPNADGSYEFSNEEKGSLLLLEDGRCIAGSYENTLGVWTGDGDVRRLLQSRGEKNVNGAIPVHAGRIVTWGYDRSLCLWSPVGQPEKAQTLGQAAAGVVAAADGRLVSWGRGNTLRVWSTELEPLQLLDGHKGRVLGARCASDGSILSWSSDHTLRKWAVDSAVAPAIGPHEDQILGARAISGGRLVSWSGDTTLRLWSRSGQPIKVMKGHSYGAAGVTELADGRLLSWPRWVTAPSPLILWTPDGDFISEIEGHSSSFNGAKVLDDDRIVSWGGDDFALRIWSNEGGLLHALLGHRLAVKEVIELENGNLVSCSADETIRIWSRDGKSLRVLTNVGRIKGLLKVEGGKFICWGYGARLRLLSSAGDTLAVLPEHRFDTAAVLRDGNVLTYGEDNTVRVYSSAGKPLRSFEVADKGFRAGLVIERENDDLLTWGGTTGTRLWSSQGTLRRSLGKFDGAVEVGQSRTLLWSKDGRVLLLTRDGKDASQWTCANQPISGVLKGTDPGTIWCLSSNAATLVRYMDKHVAHPTPQTASDVSHAAPVSTKALANAIAARSDAAADYEGKWTSRGLNATTDVGALIDFANECQWAAPELAFQARRRTATITREPEDKEHTRLRTDNSLSDSEHASTQRPVEQLIEALLQFSKVSLGLGDPQAHLNDYGEIGCWPYTGEKEIHRIMTDLAGSHDAAAGEKIRRAISARLNDYQVYNSLAPLCEVLGRLGGSGTAVFLKSLVDVQTNAWEYTRDMKRGAARGLAHLLARGEDLRDELTRIGNAYGYGEAINRVLKTYNVPAITTWDAIGASAARTAPAETPWNVSGLQEALKPYTREQRIRGFAAAAMTFRHKGSRPNAIACYVAALREEAVTNQGWIWTQLVALLSYLPTDEKVRQLADRAAAGRGDPGGDAALERLEAFAKRLH